MNNIHKIKFDWEFRLSKGSDEQIPRDILKKIKKWNKAEVPGSIYTDLINLNLIDDPFYADNEIKYGWIGLQDWEYYTEFDMPEEFTSGRKIYIYFDGIDTAADIYFNEKLIGTTDNMFLNYEFDITEKIKKKNNSLSVIIHSAERIALEREKKYGKLPVALNSSRVYIRKAQYSFGWDWGPVFTGGGIWKDAGIVQKPELLIDDVYFHTDNISENKADVYVSFKFNGHIGNYTGSVSLTHGGKRYEKTIPLIALDSGTGFEITEPALWNISGTGEAGLYELEIVVKDTVQNVVDRYRTNVGIRTIQLRLKSDNENSFCFEINGRKEFLKGFNWIPADSFINRADEDKYRELLRLVKESNANVLRVWGGGYYEKDIFYELCDQLGILVWQDFMFACAAYPEHKEFMESVEEEVKQNVKRLRNHPCIAIYCGNNENEWNWVKEQNKPFTTMPGYKIFSELLPGIIKKHDPSALYWESSPFGFDDYPNSHSSGNRHEWDLWSGWRDYKTIKNDKSLFVTEFGFQAPPDKSTMEKVIPEGERNIQSRLFQFHNKQVEGGERVMKYIWTHLPLPKGWDDYFYIAQLSQALALKFCMEEWRGNFPNTGGGIIWQINDCWPVTSWAVADYYNIPKMSYSFLRSIFNPVQALFREDEEELKVEVMNNGGEGFIGSLEINIIHTPTGKETFSKKYEISIPRGGKKLIKSLIIKDIKDYTDSIVISTIKDEALQFTARNFYSHSELKYLRFTKPEIKLKTKKISGKKYLAVKTKNPIFFLDIIHPSIINLNRGAVMLAGEEMLLPVNEDAYGFEPEAVRVHALNEYTTTE